MKSWYNTLLTIDAVKKCIQTQEFFINGYWGYREKALADYKAKQEQNENKQ